MPLALPRLHGADLVHVPALIAVVDAQQRLALRLHGPGKLEREHRDRGADNSGEATAAGLWHRLLSCG